MTYWSDSTIDVFAPVPNMRRPTLNYSRNLKKFTKTLDKVQSEHLGKKVEVWFQNEAGFGQQGTITQVWALRGSRPRAVRQTKYEWLYVIGAVCPETGQSVGLLCQSLTRMWLMFFLSSSPQKFLVMFM
jgi:hypothetical protein